MKQLITVLLLAVVLCGCMTNPVENTTTIPTASSDTTQTTTEPEISVYLPESTYEKQTGGAIKAYNLDNTYGCGVAFIGENLLVSSSDMEDSHTLTLLKGETDVVLESVSCDVPVDLNENCVVVTDDGLSYYNELTHTIVFLDKNLQQTNRVELPSDIEQGPALSQSMQQAYYGIGNEIYVADLMTGISRLLCVKDCTSMIIKNVLLDDTILECMFFDEDFVGRTEFISTKTGECLGMDQELSNIDIYENTYLVQHTDGNLFEYLLGSVGGEVLSFTPVCDQPMVYGMLESNRIVTIDFIEDGFVMDSYDIVNGKRNASVSLKGSLSKWALETNQFGTVVYFIAYDEALKKDLLYCWDTTASSVNDGEVYIGTRYTRENPDTEGIAQCKLLAQSLGETYGVNISLSHDVRTTEDYSFIYEYRVKAFEKGLEALETALEKFPAGFLRTVAEVSDNREIHIGLVERLDSKTYNSPESVSGLQYWIDGSAYIALVTGNNLEQNFYHELCHMLDTYVYSNSVAYDDWEKLNPEGFQYDENYTDYIGKDLGKYLEGENKAFIDSYSTTYEIEDRARVFEYAMMDGNEAYFQSEIMQAKLTKLCTGIRQAFGWKKSADTFVWEQYLKDSLAYTEK